MRREQLRHITSILVGPRGRCCRSAEEVLQTIERLAPTVDLISFDVFDTLLRRRVAPPERTQIPAAREVARVLQNQQPFTVQDLLQIRAAVGHELCQAAAASGNDPDCRLEDWVRAWLLRFVNDQEARRLTPQVVEIELQAEAAVGYAVEGMVEAVQKARELGKRVVYISDCYLPRAHIDALLERCGYHGLFDAGFVSCHCGRLKRTGRLFHHVLESLAVSPHRWAHIGDDLRADVYQVRRLGGRAVRLWPREHAARADRFARLRRLERVHPQWKGASIIELCQNRQAGGEADLPYRLGFSVLGPTLTNFVHRVINRSREENVELILFPAREGFLLSELYRRLAGRLMPTGLRAEYAFLTRSVVFPASVTEIGPRELHVGAKTSSRTMTMGGFLRRLALPACDIMPLAAEYAIHDEAHLLPQPREDRALLRLVNDPRFVTALQASQRRHQQLLDNYLDQLGFWGARRVALVDVGWRGTVQDALARTFANDARWPTLIGLYLGFQGDPFVADSTTCRYEGILQHRGRQPLGASPLGRFVQLFEFATRAPHATAVGLHRDATTGRVTAMLKSDEDPSRQAELRDQPMISRLQKGILAFADAYAETIPFMADPPETCSAYCLGLVDRLLRLPRGEEARLLSVHNAEDFSLPWWSATAPTADRDGNSGSWLHRLRRKSLWPEGSLAASGLGVLVPLYEALRALAREF